MAPTTRQLVKKNAVVNEQKEEQKKEAAKVKFVRPTNNKPTMCQDCPLKDAILAKVKEELMCVVLKRKDGKLNKFFCFYRNF